MISRWTDPIKDKVTALLTKENVAIIQLHPKKRVVTVSYKGQVKTGHFENNSIRNMLHGGKDFEQHTMDVLGAVAKLLEQLIKYNH